MLNERVKDIRIIWLNEYQLYKYGFTEVGGGYYKNVIPHGKEFYTLMISKNDIYGIYETESGHEELSYKEFMKRLDDKCTYSAIYIKSLLKRMQADKVIYYVS